jgi:hypothetical protein
LFLLQALFATFDYIHYIFIEPLNFVSMTATLTYTLILGVIFAGRTAYKHIIQEKNF